MAKKIALFEYTKPNFDGEWFIDYFTFTVLPSGQTPFGLVEMAFRIGNILGGFIGRNRGGNGYTHSIAVAGTGIIYFSPEDIRMGIHVSLPATAISNLRQNNINPFLEVNQLKKNGYKVNIKRVDITKDFNFDILTRVIEAIENDSYTTPSSWRVDIRSWQKQVEARTINIGKRTSAVMVRIYDKGNQLRQAGVDYQGTWHRLEYETHNDASEIVFRLYFDNWKTDLSSVMLKRFRIIDRTEKNKSRCKTSKWWADVVGSADAASLGLSRAETPLLSTMLWLETSVSGVLARIAENFGLDEYDLGAFILGMCGDIEGKAERVQQLLNGDKRFKSIALKIIMRQVEKRNELGDFAFEF